MRSANADRTVLFLLTAAAGEKKKRDDDYPDNVVVIEKIAKAVVHSEPPKFIILELFAPRY